MGKKQVDSYETKIKAIEMKFAQLPKLRGELPKPRPITNTSNALFQKYTETTTKTRNLQKLYFCKMHKDEL